MQRPGGEGPAHLRPHPVKRSEALAAYGPVINIDAPVTVNANDGTREQKGDMAKRVSREMEATFEDVVVSKIQRQMRPGICSPTGCGDGYTRAGTVEFYPPKRVRPNFFNVRMSAVFQSVRPNFLLVS